MNRLTEIRARRTHLMTRAAVERERLSATLHAWEAPLGLADKGVAAVRYVRRHPQWLAAAMVLFAVLRPKRAFSWARNGLIAWRAWRWIARSLGESATRRTA